MRLILSEIFFSKSWNIDLRHIMQEGNQCTNFLAKLGVRGCEEPVVLSSPPIELRSLLSVDAMGTIFVRN